MSVDPTAIFEACRQNNLLNVQKIYAADPSSIHAIDARGFTPLILAVYNNATEVVVFLLEKGVKTDGRDAAGNTALMGVSFKGNVELAEKLIKAGANVNERNSNGATALIFAANFGHLQMATLLLQNVADISLADASGKTPLDHARLQENWEMFDLIKQFKMQ